MKKILFAALALAAMVSCSKEYTIDNNKQVIAFGDVFVNNGTRADYSSNNKDVTAFKVYGTVDGNENSTPVYIFDGANVTKPTGNYYDNGAYNSTIAWVYDQTQYWIPGASYAFTAVVDGELTEEHTAIEFTVTDGDGDLLYATATASVEDDGTVNDLTNNLVAFSFDHLLSKLQFVTPTHNMGSDYKVVVTDIQVDGVMANGVYTIATGKWAADGNGTTPTPLSFVDDEGAFQSRQILPLEQTLNVTINYDIYFGTTAISSVEKTGTISSKEFAKGLVYTITPNITANEIKFTVKSVDGWETDINDSDIDITLQ